MFSKIVEFKDENTNAYNTILNNKTQFKKQKEYSNNFRSRNFYQKNKTFKHCIKNTTFFKNRYKIRHKNYAHQLHNFADNYNASSQLLDQSTKSSSNFYSKISNITMLKSSVKILLSQSVNIVNDSNCFSSKNDINSSYYNKSKNSKKSYANVLHYSSLFDTLPHKSLPIKNDKLKEEFLTNLNDCSTDTHVNKKFILKKQTSTFNSGDKISCTKLSERSKKISNDLENVNEIKHYELSVCNKIDDCETIKKNYLMSHKTKRQWSETTAKIKSVDINKHKKHLNDFDDTTLLKNNPSEEKNIISKTKCSNLHLTNSETPSNCCLKNCTSANQIDFMDNDISNINQFQYNKTAKSSKIILKEGLKITIDKAEFLKCVPKNITKSVVSQKIVSKNYLDTTQENALDKKAKNPFTSGQKSFLTSIKDSRITTSPIFCLHKQLIDSVILQLSKEVMTADEELKSNNKHVDTAKPIICVKTKQPQLLTDYSIMHEKNQKTTDLLDSVKLNTDIGLKKYKNNKKHRMATPKYPSKKNLYQNYYAQPLFHRSPEPASLPILKSLYWF